HTIFSRDWSSDVCSSDLRYNILEPMRTDTNIRFYDIENLQKLLNITTLHNFGYKISAISKMPAEKLPVLVKEILSKNNLTDHVRSEERRVGKECITRETP